MTNTAPVRVRRLPRRLARGLLPGHQLVLLQNGAALFPALVAAMDAARSVIHLETYIFQFAGDALRVAEALERAAQRGVTVRLVVDAIGTPQLPPEWVQRFAAAGVRWRVYAPLGQLGLLLPSRWRRLHRKLCVVDGVLGFCGGINLIDDCDDVALGRLQAPRLDFSLQVAGPLVADMVDTMEQLWWRMQAVHEVRQRDFRAAWRAVQAMHPVHDAPMPTLPGVQGARAALLLRDNLRHRHDIERAYLKAIGEARHDIIIANAYFIPGRRLRRALLLAVQRGVQVRLLLHGRYEHFFQYRAARPVYQTLLAGGVEIYEYAPSALHAKVAVLDRRWATVGSTNLDPLSLLLAREANVVTTDTRFATLLHDCLDQLLTHSGTPLHTHQRPWYQRLLDRLAFGLMRVVLFITGHRY